MRGRLLAGAAVLLAVVVAVLALGANGREGDQGMRYEIVFDNAFGLAEGGDFKIAGVRAGATTSFEIVGGRRPLALVNAQVTEPGFADLREDARCEIRPQSFIGEYFVDCQPGTSRRKLPDGGRVPVEQTSSTIPLDLVNNIFRRPYTERLRIIIGELGAGLAGRPEDLNEVLRRAHPGLRETNEVLRVLGRQTGSIRRFIRDGDRVIGELARRRDEVTRFVREAGRTAEIGASRREQLAQTFNRLPAFLEELDALHGPARRAGHRPDPAPARPAGRLPEPRHLPGAAAALRRDRHPGPRGAGRRHPRGHPRRAGHHRRGRPVARHRRERPRAREAAAPAAADHRRPAPGGRARPAGGRHRSPRGRQDPHLRPGRVHGHGGHLELLLLAGPEHQCLRRHRPHPAPERAGRRMRQLRGHPRGP